MPLRLGRPQAVVACLLLSLTSFVSPSFQYESVEHSEEREFYNGVGTEHISDGGGISKIDGLLQGMGQPKERQKNLTCHVCYSERDPLCFNLSSLHRPVGDSDSDEVDTDNEIQRHWSKKGDFNGFPLQCKNESYICSVRKFAFSLSNGTGHGPMRTFALKRNCTLSTKCEPGCVVMGERTRIYVCTTCCSSDLCNIGNGATSREKAKAISLVLLFLTLVVRQSSVIQLRV